VGKNKTPYIKD